MVRQMPDYAVNEECDTEKLAAIAHKLLVVDDDTVHRMVISRIARQAGYEVDEAASFEAARRLVGESAYACVTLDLSLGEHGGLDVLQTLSHAKFDAPIIVVSGSEDAVREEAMMVARRLSLNVCGSFAKPLNLAQLRDLLREIRKRQVVGLTPRGA
jgi:DNA-binding response OmpR family regulator